MIDSADLTWLVERRSKIQSLFLRLHNVAKDERTATEDARLVVVQSLVGATFSLWRAVFLLDQTRDRKSMHDNAMAFLEFLIQDNAINYPQDRKTAAWSGGYYLANACFRLRELGSGPLASAGLPTPPGLAAIREFLSMPFAQRVEADAKALWDSAHDVALAICGSCESGS